MRNTTRAGNKATQAMTKVGVVGALQEIALLLRLQSGGPFPGKGLCQSLPRRSLSLVVIFRRLSGAATPY